jgi:hypothetical protein
MTRSRQFAEPLLNHLVGDGEHPWRHLKAERPFEG